MADRARDARSKTGSAKILAVIPARGGSRALPGKNVRLMAGKPLIAHTVEAALASAYKPRVIVSTDDEGTASAARAAGAQVPFIRPAVLAEDATPMFPVVKHRRMAGETRKLPSRPDCPAAAHLAPSHGGSH